MSTLLPGAPPLLDPEIVRAGRPVVQKRFVEHWRARAWDFPRILDRLPSRHVVGFGASVADGFSVQRVSLSPEEIVRRLGDDGAREESPPDWFFDVNRELPEIAPDLWPGNVGPGVTRYSVLLGRDTFTRGHYHSFEHALICQVHGRKRAILYPPSDSSRLYAYPRSREGSAHEHSQVDFLVPDFGKFPEAAGARRFEFVLEPGDALFIPVHWWHAVYGEGPIMSVSVLWNATWREYGYPRPGLAALASKIRRYASAALRR